MAEGGAAEDAAWRREMAATVRRLAAKAEREAEAAFAENLARVQGRAAPGAPVRGAQPDA